MFVSFILPVVGAAMVVWGCWEARLQGKLRREGARTQGTVMRYEESHDVDGGGGKRRSYPIVAYTDTAGHRHDFQGAGSRPRWSVGTRVEVLYLPGRPRSARIATTSERMKAISVLILGGLALIAVDVLIVVMGHKRM